MLHPISFIAAVTTATFPCPFAALPSCTVNGSGRTVSLAGGVLTFSPPIDPGDVVVITPSVREQGDAGLARAQPTLEISPFQTHVATIANGASLSDIVDLRSRRVSGILMPQGWTTAALTVRVSFDGVNTVELFDLATATAVTISSASIPVNTSRYFGVKDYRMWRACRWVQFLSGTTLTPVAQGAQRLITVVTV